MEGRKPSICESRVVTLKGVGLPDPLSFLRASDSIPSTCPLRPHHYRAARRIEAAEIDWYSRRPIDFDSLDIGGIKIAVRTLTIQVDGSPVMVIHPQRRSTVARAGTLYRRIKDHELE